jgi:D-xylose transport system permease protein
MTDVENDKSRIPPDPTEEAGGEPGTGRPDGAGGVGEYVRRYVGRVRGGDMGSLPALAGLVVLVLLL